MPETPAPCLHDSEMDRLRAERPGNEKQRMKPVHNVSIRIKMLIMVIVPLIGMFIFAAREISSKTANLHNLQATSILTTYAVKSGSLIHELQKERGLSSGFLSTKGERFHDELVKQRGDTDSQLKELKEFKAANADKLEGVKERLGAADTLLEKLATTRVAVDGMKLESKESLAYYTRTITSYLDIIAQLTIQSLNPDITREAVAYHAFLSVKEQTGLERATLNEVFATNRFDEKTYERYVGIAASQTTFLDVFAKFATPDHLKTFLKKMKEPFYPQVEEMRSTALSKRQSGEFGVRPETWFATVTTMINVMKEMEDILAAHLKEKATSLADTARLSLAFSVFAAAAAAAASLIFGFVVMIGITAPLKTMAGLLKDMTDGVGNLTGRLDADRTDEIGEVNRRFNRFMDTIQSSGIERKNELQRDEITGRQEARPHSTLHGDAQAHKIDYKKSA